MVDETQLLREGGRLATDVGQRALQGVTEQGGGFFKGLLMAPVNALGGLVSGAWNGLLRNTLLFSAIFGGVITFAPDLIRPVMKLIGKEQWADDFIKTVKEKGFSGTVLAALGAGATVAAGIGGVQGTVEGAFSGGDTAAEATGSNIGGALALAAVAAVGIGAYISSDKAKASAAPAAPAPTPPAPPAGMPNAAAPKPRALGA